MKASCVVLLLLIAVPLAADAPVAAQATPEALVGGDRAVPTDMPTPEGDAGGPALVSRAAQAAPSFALPAFVVMGGGERQDLVQRGDLGGGLDTSGGIKTSPGEAGAGQDQRATEAVRAAPQDETFTPTPRYGELTASYGLGNTLNLDGLFAGEQGPFYGWLEGGTHFDDGGPLPSSAAEPAQRHDGHLAAEGGWRLDPDDLVEASLDGAWRSLRLTSVPGDAWLQREQYGASAAWEGDAFGLSQRVQVQGRQGEISLPQGGDGIYPHAYEQSGGGVDYSAEKSLGWLLMDLGADIGGLDERDQVDRSVLTEGLWFEGHLQPWSGGRLGLGLQADGVSGGTRAFQWGPRLHFEQRLTKDLGLRLEYGTGIQLSRLDGGAFTEDPLLPNPAARPEREVANFKAALPWQPLPALSLEAGAFVREDEDAFLPGQAPAGLWTDTTVGTLGVVGGSLSERLTQGPWWQDFQGLGQKADLATAGLTPTFIPNWKASAAVGFKQGAWSFETGLKAVGPREADLAGAWVVPAQFDWRLRVGFDVNDSLTLFVEGDSLAGPVSDWPLYTDPSPYLGLGAKLRF